MMQLNILKNAGTEVSTLSSEETQTMTPAPPVCTGDFIGEEIRCFFDVIMCVSNPSLVIRSVLSLKNTNLESRLTDPCTIAIRLLLFTLLTTVKTVYNPPMQLRRTSPRRNPAVSLSRSS